MSKNNTINNSKRFGRAITAALLLFVILSLSLITTSCSKKFDYLKTDLHDYIEFTEDYKNFKVNIDIARPHEIDVEIAILNMLYNDREEKPLNGGNAITSPVTITTGDVLDVWYRGYIISDSGEKIDIGISNFGNSKPVEFSIGANNLALGIDLALIGKNTGDFPKFEKITSGEINEDMMIYVSYTRTKGTDSKTKVTESAVRMDPTTDLDAVYGSGVKEKLLKMKVGDVIDFTATINGESYTYTDFTVDFVTTCEKNPVVIEGYFAYDYSKAELRNENVFFEIYIDGVVVYDCPEFTNEYLQKKIEDKEINLTLDELNEYEGKDLTDKYRAYAMKKMNDYYDESYKSMVEDAVWSHFAEISKAKKYPTDKVEEVYDDYVDDFSAQFISSGGKVTNAYGQSQTYDTFDAYITASLGLNSTQKWQDVVYAECANYIKERLVMFYIIREENLLPTDAELKAEYDAEVDEFIEEAIDQYLYYSGTTKDDYTEEEYAEVVEECRDMVFSSFDEEYFTIRAYYRILAKTAITWPEVSTLNDRRAYPQDK